MAQFNSLTPMLYTRELGETVKFYTEVLGFECTAYEEEWGWASVIKDDVEFMFANPNEHIPYERAGFTGSFYIRTNDVDVLWDEWNTKCDVCYGIEEFEYGMREFAIYDNNGYLLQFGQPIE